jgi:hypothetical protein
VENPPLAKGDEGGFYDEEVFEKNRSSTRKDVEIFMMDKISPFPSLLKRGVREKLILRCIHRNV